jgi:hypothetical protein
MRQHHPHDWNELLQPVDEVEIDVVQEELAQAITGRGPLPRAVFAVIAAVVWFINSSA